MDSIFDEGYVEQRTVDLMIPVSETMLTHWAHARKGYKQGTLLDAQALDLSFPYHNPMALALNRKLRGGEGCSGGKLWCALFPGIVQLGHCVLRLSHLPTKNWHLLKQGQDLHSFKFLVEVPVEIYVEYFLSSRQAITFFNKMSLAQAMSLVRNLGRILCYHRAWLDQVGMEQILQKRFPQIKWDFMQTPYPEIIHHNGQYIETIPIY